MPAPQSSLMKNNVRTKFSSFGLKVPTNWKDPTGDPAEKHYKQIVVQDTPAMSPQPLLFQSASSNKPHVDTQKMHITEVGKFIDKTCDAICFAWDKWQTLASMAGFVVTGPIGLVGKVVGIPWMPLILAQGAMSTPKLMQYTTVVATVLGNAWLQYTLTITSPGIPMWPMFALFPSPVVPPTPNPAPIPLMSFTQVDAMLQPAVLKQQMIGMLGDPAAPFHKELFESIATGFNQCFMTWKASTTLKNIMGMGAVPSCVPPIMPPGPVVGTAMMPPGGFT